MEVMGGPLDASTLLEPLRPDRTTVTVASIVCVATMSSRSYPHHHEKPASSYVAWDCFNEERPPGLATVRVGRCDPHKPTEPRQALGRCPWRNSGSRSGSWAPAAHSHRQNYVAKPSPRGGCAWRTSSPLGRR